MSSSALPKEFMRFCVIFSHQTHTLKRESGMSTQAPKGCRHIRYILCLMYVTVFVFVCVYVHIRVRAVSQSTYLIISLSVSTHAKMHLHFFAYSDKYKDMETARSPGME